MVDEEIDKEIRTFENHTRHNPKSIHLTSIRFEAFKLMMKQNVCVSNRVRCIYIALFFVVDLTLRVHCARTFLMICLF